MSLRLPPVPDEWIQRHQPISFIFEGCRYWGYAGDSITSALWASGQRVLGRSFKYHRPRGLLSLANQDVNTLMQSGQVLNLRADVTPIVEGMCLTAVNTFGGVMGDRASVLNFFAPFLPVGFYYKAFHNKGLFPIWERLIRRLTGLGKVDFTTPHIPTPKRYDFCDVLVIGAGVAGLSAALSVAEAGAEVVIVEENAQAGGTGRYQLGGHRTQATETMALLQTIQHHPQIRLYTNTQAAGYYADHWIPLVHTDYLSKMRAKAVIVASGAFEQPAVFHNNDLPGVMLASAAQRLIYHYAVKPMQRAVVLTANRDGYRAALDLVAYGVIVVAIVDLRPHSVGELVEKLRDAAIPIFPGYCVYAAQSNPAGDGVCGAVICPLDSNGNPQPQRQQTLSCDGIIMSVGWAPAANLLLLAGTRMQFDEQLQQFVPKILPEGIFACGRVNGVYDFEQKMLDGQRAGLEAATYLGLGTFPSPKIVPESESPSHPYPFIPHPKGKNFVDFDEDLQLSDLHHGVQEGFDNIELLKRYTTIGMGPSQGKHSNMNAVRILARLTGKNPAEVGTTTVRPFWHPVPLSHLAGRGFTPERTTPLHNRHSALGAKFTPVGGWMRPEYYIIPGKSRKKCIWQEAQTVRNGVGLIDVGTLGKLEIYGSDAAQFLERVYTGRYTNLKVGMTRYALMLDEAGIVIDDGVIARLESEHFYFTTTTSGSTPIYRELSRLNVVWQLDCGIVNLTGAQAAVNLVGPHARDVLSQLTQLDLSGSHFPYLGVRRAKVAGIPAILMRLGFVGEWGYEIHVPAEFAVALWDALLEAGASYDIQPFGVEAQRLLRLEKGHLIVGQDTDGLTTPFEAGLEWAVKLDKSFFIGQRSLQTIAKHPLKQKLVGFILNANFADTPPQECHLVIADGDIAGRITSIAYSPTLKQYIGLAFVKPELAQKGNQFSIRLTNGALVTATVSSIPFYDAENSRQGERGRGGDSEAARSAGERGGGGNLQVFSSLASSVSVAQLTLTDFSFLPRFGVKGADAGIWLESQGIPTPQFPNTWCSLPEGGLVARLGKSEFLIEDSLDTSLTSRLAEKCQIQTGKVYPVLRQDFTIALSGAAIHDLLRQTCSFNFSALALDEQPVVLTSMIGVSVIVIPGDSVYRIWCDRSFGSYFWRTVWGVGGERGGGGCSWYG